MTKGAGTGNLEIVTLLDGPGGPSLVSRILASCSDICFPSEAETSLQYAEGDTQCLPLTMEGRASQT